MRVSKANKAREARRPVQDHLTDIIPRSPNNLQDDEAQDPNHNPRLNLRPKIAVDLFRGQRLFLAVMT